jgi:hypothetical protein
MLSLFLNCPFSETNAPGLVRFVVRVNAALESIKADLDKWFWQPAIFSTWYSGPKNQPSVFTQKWSYNYIIFSKIRHLCREDIKNNKIKRKQRERRTIARLATILISKENFLIHWKYQVAAWVPDMLSNFYLVKNNKTAYNSATTEARIKISTDLECFEF